MTGNTSVFQDSSIPPQILTEYWARSVNRAIAEMAKAFYKVSHKEGITQDIIALRLGKDKSIISRILRGHTKNLTIKTVAEMALAMDCDLQIQLVHKSNLNHGNQYDHYKDGLYKYNSLGTDPSSQWKVC